MYCYFEQAPHIIAMCQSMAFHGPPFERYGLTLYR